MKQIMASNYYYPAVVDDEDYDFLIQFNWNFINGYFRTTESKSRCMHRMVLSRKLGYPITDDIICDHINHNRLDNTRSNLRPVNPKQNSWNRRNRYDSAIEYKGVCMDKNKYRAEIKVPDGKRKFLGNYDTAEQAAYQYNSASHMLFGEYAYLNDLPIVTNTKTGQVVTGRIYKDDYTMYEPNITSKYYGVGYRKNSGRWRARIRRDGHDIILGEYNNEMDAANAVDNYLVNKLHEEPRNFK